MRDLRVPIVGAVLAAVAVAAFLPMGTEAQQSVTVQLAAQNNSGITGTATLTPDGAGTRVVLQLQNAGAGPEPAHIHQGTCANLNPTPMFPLTSVVNGRSETTVNVSLVQLLASPTAVNVHKSPQEVPVYVSCGNITAAAAAAPAVPAVPGVPAAPAAQPSPAPKPAAPAPAAAPAQAPKPAASPAAQAPAGLPRTGDADNTPMVLLAVFGGLALVGAGAFMIRRRRSA
ncbi:MAG TPA: LPXTG cell wall anchor domain-containing protein [Chloroflexota bacterium]|nr:LPXTG cell wall anchor domain-containing protein [Chloroflexota bacterium]